MNIQHNIRKVQVIINGSKDPKRDLIDDLKAMLAGCKIESNFYHTILAHPQPSNNEEISRIGHVSDLERMIVSAAQHDMKDTIWIGGDGSIHDGVNGLLRSDINNDEFTVSVIPIGTGNDFARSLGIHSVRQAFDVIKDHYTDYRSRPKKVDVMSITSGKFSRYCINVAGTAFDAKVIDELHHDPGLKKFGNLAYAIAGYRCFWDYKPMNLTLDITTGTRDKPSIQRIKRENVFLAVLLNSTDAGGRLYFCPDAEIDDGSFDLALVSDIKRFPLLLLAKSRLRYRTIVDHPNVEYIKGIKEITLKAEGKDSLGNAIELDGELYHAAQPLKEIRYAHSGHNLRFLTR